MRDREKVSAASERVLKNVISCYWYDKHDEYVSFLS